jgi:predicted ferric reductase
MLSKNLNMLSKRRGNMSAFRLEHTSEDEAVVALDPDIRKFMRNGSDRSRIKQHLLGSFSFIWGIFLAVLCAAMQTDVYRSWYKKAFKPWDTREYYYYYSLFVWLPIWFPVLAIGAAIFFLQQFKRRGAGALGKPTEHLLHRRWLPSVTPIEAVAYVLITLTAIAWVFEKSYRTVERSGWTQNSMNGLAESLGIGTIPLLAGILLPAKATTAVFSFLNLTPERAISYHKWIGFGVVILVTLHGLAYFVVIYKLRGGWEGIRIYMFTMATCKTHSKCVPAGLAAMVAGLVFGFFSIYTQRRLNWRRFRVFHVLGTPVFFLGTVGHWSKFVWYLTPSLALYMAQVTLRLHQHFYTVDCLVAVEERENHHASTEDIVAPPPELAEEEEDQRENHSHNPATANSNRLATIIRGQSSSPNGQNHGMSDDIKKKTEEDRTDRVVLRFKLPWLAGHTHCGQWIGVGSASRWFPEIHPATIISAPRLSRPELALALHRKSALAEEILTCKKRMSEGHWTVCRLKLKGPYGGVAPLDPCVPTLLIAGGTGVTPILSLLNQEQQDTTCLRYDNSLLGSEGIAQRKVCWTLRGNSNGLGLMQGVWPQLRGLDCPNITVHGTGAHSNEVEKIFMNGGDDDAYSNSNSREEEEQRFQKKDSSAYFLHPSIRCAPPDPETDPILPSIAACVGAMLGLYTWFYLDQWCLDIGLGFLRGILTMLIQAGLAFLFVLGTILVVLVLKKMNSRGEGEHLLMPLYANKHSAYPSESKAHSSMASANIQLGVLDKQRMSSISLSSEDLNENGNNKEHCVVSDLIPGGHRFIHGRPKLRAYLDDMCPHVERVDVVVAGPPGLVHDCKAEIAKHPSCGKIRLRELSFEI